jgi:hypothetical protein
MSGVRPSHSAPNTLKEEQECFTRLF